jgi:ornithine cyclodeaminase
MLFDKDLARARQFGSRCRELLNREVTIAEDLNTTLRASTLVSIATTATKPHIFDLSESLPGTTILHVSLRDFSPEVIMASDNVVDDIDHVCRAQTSVHLAEQLAGNRTFIRCCLADILLEKQIARRDPRRITIFNPFGLGILDLAVGEFVRRLAVRQSLGTAIPAFLPQPWIERL